MDYFDQIYGPNLRQQPTRPSILPWVTVAIIAIAYANQNGWINFGPINNNDKNDVVVIDPNDEDVKPPTPQPVKLDGSYIVRVFETETESCPVWLVKLLDNDAFWFDWIPENGMKFYSFDPDNPQSKSLLAAGESAGISPPFWLHAKSGNVLSVQPFRESDTTENIIERLAR